MHNVVNENGFRNAYRLFLKREPDNQGVMTSRIGQISEHVRHTSIQSDDL